MSRHNILAHDSARDVRKLRANPNQRGATSKQPLPARPAGQAVADAAATSPIAEANRNQDLAELVWRHFREEIGQTLAEVQEDLAHRQSSSDYKVDQEKGRKMAKSRFIHRNSSFGSVREPGSCNVQPDANDHENIRKEVINIDALRVISRIVLALQQRIDAGNDTGTSAEPDSPRNSGGSKTTGPHSGKNHSRGETADQ